MKSMGIVAGEYREIAPGFHVVNEEQIEQIKAVLVPECGEEFAPDKRIQVPGEGGQPPVELCVYCPNHPRSAVLPAIYYMHGGGYILGTADMDGENLKNWANTLNVIFISVEYRLSTAAPFPADVHDAYHGLSYVFDHAAELSVAPDKIAVMGESAGGGLAARLALYARDQRKYRLAAQILIYPMLDCRTGSEASLYKGDITGEFVWTRELNQMGWASLRGGQEIAEQDLPYYSAALTKNYRDLPKTFIMAGALDLFVNECVDYANHLLDNGIDTELHVIPGVFHAFEKALPTSPQARQYIMLRDAFIHNAFQN